jgi:glycosyltransferase involved in cell wall biosynthesis
VNDEGREHPGDVDVSIVIPLQNEADNVEPLYAELSEVLSSAAFTAEIIFVDDGSRDGTVERLIAAAGKDPRCTLVELRRNFGQTAALAAGFRRARGRCIVPMDGDLQNDPHDIPALVAQLDEPPGYDVVSGWRKRRHDHFWTRRLPSRLANRLIAWITSVAIHDFGCTLKAYRREVLDDVSLYGEMHRFLPVITRWQGARITEKVVNHRPRIHGRTKYGLRRTIKVLLDLITVKFLGGYLTKPLYFFGKLALVGTVLAFGTLGVAVAQKYGYFSPDSLLDFRSYFTQTERLHLNRNVLVLMSVMLMLMSVIFLTMGVLSELLVRIYHESQGRVPYKIRRVRRGGGSEPAEPTRPHAPATADPE